MEIEEIKQKQERISNNITTTRQKINGMVEQYNRLEYEKVKETYKELLELDEVFLEGISVIELNIGIGNTLNELDISTGLEIEGEYGFYHKPMTIECNESFSFNGKVKDDEILAPILDLSLKMEDYVFVIANTERKEAQVKDEFYLVKVSEIPSIVKGKTIHSFSFIETI